MRAASRCSRRSTSPRLTVWRRRAGWRSRSPAAGRRWSGAGSRRFRPDRSRPSPDRLGSMQECAFRSTFRTSGTSPMPGTVATVATAAEQAGWDGLFVWDHVVHSRHRRPFGDPWMLLTAAALATSRIRLGTLVTPVARRRPQQLARQVATLDSLSGGRVIFGAGLGGPIEDEYGSFGEPTDPVVLAERLDEGLDLLQRYWSGEPVNHHGRHYRVRGRDLAARHDATSPPAGLDRRILAAPPTDAPGRPLGRRRPAVRRRQARTRSACRPGSRPGRLRPSAPRRPGRSAVRDRRRRRRVRATRPGLAP